MALSHKALSLFQRLPVTFDAYMADKRYGLPYRSMIINDCINYHIALSISD
jgi:hypothetical protein